MTIYLLSIRGTLVPPTVEAARAIHNETAGAAASVAAAQALGDLSHMVYVPVDTAGEFLILDRWDNLEGLGQFFANPQIQEEAELIFSTREPIVWAPADGFVSYHLPTPSDQSELIVAVVRGTVRSRAEAQALHNATVVALVNQARQAGSVSHEAYFRMAEPETPEALEFLAVDVWMSVAGMQQHYSNPELLGGFQDLVEAPPSISTWVHPEGEWVEW